MGRFPVDKIKDFSKYKDKDKVNDIAFIEGSWLTGMTVGDTEYWNMEKHRPSRMVADVNQTTEQEI